MTKEDIEIRKAKLKELRAIAENQWEGYHGCTEQDKEMWIKGYMSGYFEGEVKGTMTTLFKNKL